jgi:hypothetical protein
MQGVHKGTDNKGLDTRSGYSFIVCACEDGRPTCDIRNIQYFIQNTLSENSVPKMENLVHV